MKFENGSFLNYCVIDLSSDDGQTIDPDGKFFVYNPEAIDPQCPHNIVFVHGYNTDFFGAVSRGIDYFDTLIPLVNGDANFIIIFWPGNTDAVEFSKAVRQASASAPNFSAAINYIIKNSTATNPFVSLIAHSLGNRECAQTILTLESQYKITPVRKFIQLAAAINADSYDANATDSDFKRVPALVQSTVVYYSQNDTVLKNAYGTWNALLNWDFNAAWGSLFKQKRPDDAMGFLGPYGSIPQSVQTIDANTIAGVNVDHGTYLTNQNLIKDVARLVNPQ